MEIRIRQMAWWRTPVLPAGSMVIGNQPMDDPGTVKLAPHGPEIHRASGKRLMEEGFQVTIKESYEGNIYEVGLE